MTDPRHRRRLGRPDLLRMNLPEEHWCVNIAQVSEPAQSSVRRYVGNLDRATEEGAGLLIHGSRGVGKTSVAALLLKACRSLGYTTFFSQVWELRELIRSRAQFDSDSSIADRIREVEVLVLDDLREEDTQERFFPLSEIIELVRYRVSRRRLTFVTTRISGSRLMEDPVSGLADMLLFFPMEGPDLREQRNQALEEELLG